MSLVSTYVKMTDGFFYKNPTIYGDGWYICFDDDDPPELVSTNRGLNPQKFLKGIGVDADTIYKGVCSWRLYPPRYKKFVKSQSWFFELKHNINSENLTIKHEGKTEKLPDIGCVFYDSEFGKERGGK